MRAGSHSTPEDGHFFIELLGSLEAPASHQIEIAERVLAERPQGVYGFWGEYFIASKERNK